ncbi:MAG: hypothetical protein ACTSR8_10965 [Promethearchaeota archaeon]
MYEVILNDFKEKMLEIAIRDDELDLIIALDQLFSEKFDPKEGEEIRRYEKKEKQFIKKMIVDCMGRIVKSNPNYPLGLILISLGNFALERFRAASDYAQKAQKLLDYNSDWYIIALDLFQKTISLVDEFPKDIEYLDEVIFDIKKTTAAEQDLTLLCPACQTFNNRKSKNCSNCGLKFTKEMKKGSK